MTRGDEPVLWRQGNFDPDQRETIQQMQGVIDELRRELGLVRSTAKTGARGSERALSANGVTKREVVVVDEKAVAAQGAAELADGKAVEAKAAADVADGKAVEAIGAAEAADEKAQEALDRPAGGTTITVSTEDPTTMTPPPTAPDGAIWWQEVDGVTIGQWRMTAGTWTPMEVGMDVIAGDIIGRRIVGAEIEGGTIEGEVSITSGGSVVAEGGGSVIARVPTRQSFNARIGVQIVDQWASYLSGGSLTFSPSAGMPYTSGLAAIAADATLLSGVRRSRLLLEAANGEINLLIGAILSRKPGFFGVKTVALEADEFYPGAIFASAGVPWAPAVPIALAKPVFNPNFASGSLTIEWGGDTLSRPARSVGTATERQRFVAPQDGYYIVAFSIRPMHDAGSVVFILRKNGTSIPGASIVAAVAQVATVTMPVRLLAGEYVDVFLNANFAGGTTANRYVDANSSTMSMMMHSAL